MTREQLETARQMRADGLMVMQIAARFGVNRKTISAWLNDGERILAHIKARAKGRKPRRRHRRSDEFARREEIAPKIRAALESGRSMIAVDIAAEIGVANVKVVASLLCSLERQGALERAGVVGSGKNARPLFCKTGAKPAVEPAAPKRLSPGPRYRSPLAEMMGEPPIGRSALEQREAQA